MEELKITSSAFENGGLIPKRHTGFGEDLSPAFNIEGLSEQAVSLAVTMDDLDIPGMKTFSHWVIWNIPKTDTLAEGIPQRKTVPELGNAVQGLAWGKNRYRGPKQPPFIRKAHRYRVTFFALDCFLELDASKSKRELLSAIKGHTLQTGSITGVYKP